MDVLINGSDVEVRSAVMTLLPCRSCQLRTAMDISRESCGEKEITSSAADLGQAPGKQGAHTRGQCCRETAVPMSSSCAPNRKAGAVIYRRQERE